MAGITALGTTYNLPNYTGILFALTPADTPFFSAIGGLTGGKQTTSTEFEWEGFDLRDPAQPEILEGADAPTLSGRVRANYTNVCQIHHSAVGVSYSKLAAFGMKSGSNNEEMNPVRSELDWQVEQELVQMVRDVNYSLINGTYQKPVNNSTGRKTRGFFTAISTNSQAATETLVGNGDSVWEADDEVITEAAHGLAVNDRVRISIDSGATGATAGYFWVLTVPSSSTFTVSPTKGGTVQSISADGVVDVYKCSPLTVAKINGLFQAVYDNGGLSRTETSVILVNSGLKVAISAMYADAYGKYTETTRNIGGVAVDTVVTDFGTLGIMVDRAVPQGTLGIAALDQCAPVFLEVPDPKGGMKGHFFAEELAKTGASDRTQLYGEVGLMYGNEKAHGKMVGLPY